MDPRATTSNFGVGNLGAMDLEIRVRRLENENQLEMEFLFRLNQDLAAVQSDLNATIHRQRELNTKLSNFSNGKKVLSFKMLFFYKIYYYMSY